MAHAVESLGPFKTYGIFADGHGRMSGRACGPADDGPAGRRPPYPPGRPDRGGARSDRGRALHARRRAVVVGLRAGRQARPVRLSCGRGQGGTRRRRPVRCCMCWRSRPGSALANAHLHGREREQARELGAANLALRRSMSIHDRLTRVALSGEGQDGIAQAVDELTGCPVAIEDRFGNRRAWAGPGEPDPGPKPAGSAGPAADPDRRGRRPVRDGDRVVSVALLGGSPRPCSSSATSGGSPTPSAWRSSTRPRCWPWRSRACRAWPRTMPGCAWTSCST